MRRAILAALVCVLTICGCDSHSAPPSASRYPSPAQQSQPQSFTEPESAVTPDGAVPAPPSTALQRPVSGESTVDAAGLNLIGGFEGFSSCPYQDVVGVWTIGYGVTSGSGFLVGPRTACESRATGLAQLATLVRSRYEPSVHAVSASFGQNAVNALDSFAYNLGGGIFTGSLRADLQRHDYQDAGAIMLQYDHAGGLVLAGLRTRRIEEVSLLRKPDAKPKPPPSRRDLEARRRALRRVLLRYDCRTRKAHKRKLGPTCLRWYREGAQVNRELR